jgi:hypothetical protein
MQISPSLSQPRRLIEQTRISIGNRLSGLVGKLKICDQHEIHIRISLSRVKRDLKGHPKRRISIEAMHEHPPPRLFSLKIRLFSIVREAIRKTQTPAAFKIDSAHGIHVYRSYVSSLKQARSLPPYQSIINVFFGVDKGDFGQGQNGEKCRRHK